MSTRNAESTSRRPPMAVADAHYVNGKPLAGPFPAQLATAIFGMGCFWGAEKLFWQLNGVYSTAVGYAGGDLVHPTYREVCRGDTGHAEVVLVVYDPTVISYARLLKYFWEGHNPTQGFRQGNDVGDQYRSTIYTTTEDQAKTAQASMEAYAEQLRRSGHDRITTQIASAPTFYYAEDNHQQYLAKHPGGYCGLGGTGVTCSVPVAAHSQRI